MRRRSVTNQLFCSALDTGVMEISLLKALLNNISSYFHLSSHENINHEPAQKYYQKIEEILKLLKPVLEAVFDADIMFEEPLPKAFADLGHSINELRMLFENWHSLGSKINFVCFGLYICNLHFLKSREADISFHKI